MGGKQPTFVRVVYLAQLSAANMHHLHIAKVRVESSDVTSGDTCIICDA